MYQSNPLSVIPSNQLCVTNSLLHWTIRPGGHFDAQKSTTITMLSGRDERAGDNTKNKDHGDGSSHILRPE